MRSGLGSGQVEYTAARPLIHFGLSPEDVQEIQTAHRLNSIGFEIAKE